MAFIQGREDDELQGNPQTGQGGGGQAPLVGGSSSQVGQGSGTGVGPAGAGGSGGWTNIQNYLKANEGDTGSAQALSSKVGGQFNQEREKMQGDSSAFLQDAQKYSDENSLTQGQVDNYVKRGSELYNWTPNAPKSDKDFGSSATNNSQEKVTPGGGSQLTGDSNMVDTSADYQDLVSKMQSGLNNQYGGAREYNYGLSNQAQEYGANLKDQGGFDQLMNHIYSGSANRPLSSGQFALQKQLDVGNVGLSNARSNLTSQYDQLGADRDTIVSNTTKSLGDLEHNYNRNQLNMRDYLQNKATGLDEDIARSEAAARAEYNQNYTTGRSTQENVFQPWFTADSAHGGTLRDMGVWGADGTDLTWQQLQREQDYLKAPDAAFYTNLTRHGDGGNGNLARSAANLSALEQWYGQQDAQYANTADEQERGYNVLMDFLGLDNKKQQGFKVRG